MNEKTITIEKKEELYLWYPDNGGEPMSDESLCDTYARLEHFAKRAEDAERQLCELDAEWVQRFKEQADQWHLRTKMIRKQLETLVEMSAKNRLLTPPTIIINKEPLWAAGSDKDE